jgi:hypothetical protein
MECAPYSPELAPHDFFLFGATKEDFAVHRLDGLDDLFDAIESFLGVLSEDFL